MVTQKRQTLRARTLSLDREQVAPRRVFARAFDIFKTSKEQRLSFRDEGSNSGATMAVQDDAKWEDDEFKIDRFGLDVKETNDGGLLRAGSKLVSMISGSKDDKKENQCQVDGCSSDISTMKEYHARYKICEQHLRASLVTNRGREQRFCQQCGKFHNIEEFDGDKRSCRARLEKHNVRRRRQREMQHMLRTTGRIDEAALRRKYGMTEAELAPKIQKLHRQMRLSNNTTNSNSSGGQSLSGNSNGSAGNYPSMPVPGLPGITQADLDLLGDGFLEDVLGPGGLASVHASGQHGNAATSFLSIDPTTVMDLDDMTVLEELTKEFGFNPNDAAFAAASNAGAANGAAAAGQTVRTLPKSPFITAGMTLPEHIGQGMSTAVPSPYSQAQQAVAFPFLSNATNALMANPGVMAAAAAVAQQELQQQQRQHHAPRQPSFGPRTVTTGVSGLPPYLQANGVAVGQLNQVRSSASSDATSVLEEALNLLAYDHSQVHYAADERLVRLSAKLFGCTPADLPADLKASLQDMLAVDSMEGYMRPGCVHLEVNAMVNSDGQALVTEGGMHGAVQRFLESSPGSTSAAHTVVMQLGDKLAMVQDGKLLYVVDTAGASRLMPSVSAVRPLAVTPPSRGGSVMLSIWGYNLGREGDVVLARSQGRHLQVDVVGEPEERPEWQGLQRLEVRVKGPLHPGTVQVEVMRGAYASAARAVLVAPTPEVAGEIATLEATPDVGEVDALIYELGALVEATSSINSAALATAGPVKVGNAARRLLPFTIQRKWPALAGLALSASVLDNTSPSEAMSSSDVYSVRATGMSLLHLAVRTQSADMVTLLLNWGRSKGHEFKATTPGRRGLAAVHFAALISDGGLIAALLTAACPDALNGWEGARAEDGSTPLGLATQFGTLSDLERVIAQAQYFRMQAKGASAAAAVAGADGSIKNGNSNLSDASAFSAFDNDNDRLANMPSSSFSKMMSAKGGLSIERLASEIDDVAIAKAAYHGTNLSRDAASSALLTFACPALEAKYAQWYHMGQIPVDIAFMMITILSQMAWMLRWNMYFSILGAVMTFLIAFNSAYLTLAVTGPRHYIARREWLCIISLFVHKLGQMAVTAMPGTGTIYSPTYNIKIALLESSSFAQIAMLSFGAKARVAYHLPTLLAMLPLSATINGDICKAAFGSVDPLLCASGMFVFQAIACCALPVAAVYMSERRSRRIFLQTAVA
ncbi:hypothetical protein Ndes2526A_g07018 [Nannochloris sp. 'desiccata']